MACIYEKGNGNLAFSGPTDPCMFQVLSASEYEQAQLALMSTDTDFYNLLVTVFAQPSTPEIITAFMAAFSIPVIVFLVSDAYGRVINWFDED